jgi:hypothetical protein
VENHYRYYQFYANMLVAGDGHPTWRVSGGTISFNRRI